MHRVTLTTTKKIGNIEEIIERTFNIPEWIFCPEDGKFMAYKPASRRYECSECKKIITAKGYINEQIRKVENFLKQGERTSSN